MVDRVVQPGELLNVANSVATKILANAPMAVELAKLAINQAVAGGTPGYTVERLCQTVLFGMEDLKEGVAAFFERRPPRFHGI